MDQISQKSSLNKKLVNVIFPPFLDRLTEHHWVMWSLSYRADHDNHPGKFVDRIFSINEVSHSMDSWFLRKVLEKSKKLQKEPASIEKSFSSSSLVVTHAQHEQLGMENKKIELSFAIWPTPTGFVGRVSARPTWPLLWKFPVLRELHLLFIIRTNDGAI